MEYLIAKFTLLTHKQNVNFNDDHKLRKQKAPHKNIIHSN